MGKDEDLTAKGQYRLIKMETQSGIKVKPSYGPDDLAGLDYEKDLGDPGQWPFTRATHDGLYRNMLWLHENLYMTGSERFKETWIHRVGLSMPNPPGYDGNFFYNPCDAAREAGVDPDHPMAQLEIGCAGNVHYCLRNLEDDLETVTDDKLRGLFLCSLDAPSHGDTPRYAQHIALFEKRGIPLEEMRGFQVNDGIHIHIIRWCDSNPLDLSFRLSVDSMEFSARNTPRYYPICPNMYDMRETGIDVIQEVAFNLSERIAFIDEAMKRGVKFEQLTHRIDISFTGEIDFFETICKIRAARRMWARIAKEKYGCTDPKYMRPPTGINMAGSAMTAQQPVNNLSRIAIISLACTLAGVRSIQPKNFLEPLPVPWLPGTMLPSIATQYIIAHETGVPLVADPLGGSYYVEWLTNKIEEEAGKLMKEIEDRGGILECIRSGWIQGEAEKKALDLQKELEEGRRIQVGVNAFQVPKDLEVPIPQIELEDLEKWPGGEKFEGLEEYQVKILKEIKEFKEGRDLARTKEGLLRLREASQNGENLIRPMIEAYKADATTGEVMGMVREGMGYSYDPFNTIERPEFLNQ